MRTSSKPDDGLNSDTQAVPRLNFKAFTPSDADFAAWCDDPVTEWVVLGLESMIEDCRLQWEELSWRSGKHTDPQNLGHMLTELKSAAEAFAVLKNSKKADYERYIRNPR